MHFKFIDLTDQTQCFKTLAYIDLYILLRNYNLPRPHIWIAYMDAWIARIVTVYWHIFPLKTQNTLRMIWLEWTIYMHNVGWTKKMLFSNNIFHTCLKYFCTRKSIKAKIGAYIFFKCQIYSKAGSLQLKI